MKKLLLFFIFTCIVFNMNAQIGYQVSLLNTATGEPRANVTVNATVTITNTKNETIYTGTQKVTSNDFGVLSLTVGNAETFKNVDFGKLPFFIEVDVDGQMIGKSQILNVPVAETAKTLTPVLSMDELCNKEWPVVNGYYSNPRIILYPDMTGCKIYELDEERTIVYPFRYILQGNLIIVYAGEVDQHLYCFVNGFVYLLSQK